MKHTLIAALSALVLVTGVPALTPVARADKPAHESPSYHPKISLDEARKAALKRVPGTILDEELEKEDGQWIYSFDIRPRARKRKIIKEVHVDPETGKILGIETERDKS